MSGDYQEKKMKITEKDKIKYLNEKVIICKEEYDCYLRFFSEYFPEKIALKLIITQKLMDERIEKLADKPKEFSRFLFGDKKKYTIIEELKNEIKYYKSLINLCEEEIKSLNKEEMKKLANKYFEISNTYFKTLENNYKGVQDES